MKRAFDYEAAKLSDIFGAAGRGFYIPYYQRPYSWTEDNAAQLVDDIFDAVDRTVSKPDHIIFLGTLILHDERQPELNRHQDTAKLLTKIVNIVDGQQRLTTISLLSCVLTHVAKLLIKELDGTSNPDAMSKLKIEITNICTDLEKLYSVKLEKHGALPQQKPIIIRPIALDKNPIADQWTLKGEASKYYKSDVAQFLSKFIIEKDLSVLRPEDDTMSSVVDKLLEKIEWKISNANYQTLVDLQRAHTEKEGNLGNFVSEFPDLAVIKTLTDSQQITTFKSIYLLALVDYFLYSCQFVSVETSDLNLALDMFQALNATGTPLTAFEVFKPKLVEDWDSKIYGTQIKPHVDRAEKAFNDKRRGSDRSQITIDVVMTFALIFNGKMISKHFTALPTFFNALLWYWRRLKRREFYKTIC